MLKSCIWRSSAVEAGRQNACKLLQGLKAHYKLQDVLLCIKAHKLRPTKTNTLGTLAGICVFMCWNMWGDAFLNDGLSFCTNCTQYKKMNGYKWIFTYSIYWGNMHVCTDSSRVSRYSSVNSRHCSLPVHKVCIGMDRAHFWLCLHYLEYKKWDEMLQNKQIYVYTYSLTNFISEVCLWMWVYMSTCSTLSNYWPNTHLWGLALQRRKREEVKVKKGKLKQLEEDASCFKFYSMQTSNKAAVGEMGSTGQREGDSLEISPSISTGTHKL